MSATKGTVPVDIIMSFDLGADRFRAVGLDPAAERVLVVEKQRGRAPVCKTSLTLDHARRLAEATIEGRPEAITRPTAQLELAAVFIALVAALTQPDLVPAFLGGLAEDGQPPAEPAKEEA
jgi:hypothetical protein